MYQRFGRYIKILLIKSERVQSSKRIFRAASRLESKLRARTRRPRKSPILWARIVLAGKELSIGSAQKIVVKSLSTSSRHRI